MYVHENQINGKVYVGKCLLPSRRFLGKGWGYTRHPRFIEDIKKYGWDNFSHEILYDDLTEAEAYRLEAFLIDYYSANNPKYGYNRMSGRKLKR